MRLVGDRSFDLVSFDAFVLFKLEAIVRSDGATPLGLAAAQRGPLRSQVRRNFTNKRNIAHITLGT